MGYQMHSAQRGLGLQTDGYRVGFNMQWAERVPLHSGKKQLLLQLAKGRHNAAQMPPLQGFGSGSRSICAFATPGFRAFACANFGRFAAMPVTGCPCSEMRAAPFTFRKAASWLELAVPLRFGAPTPCCGRRPLSQLLLANSFQVVLLEVRTSAEERLVGFGGCAAIVFRRSKFDSANVVGKLEKPIVLRRNDAVDDGLFGKRELDGVVQDMGDFGLSVVVVDLHLVKVLEELEVVEQKGRQLLFEGFEHALRIVSERWYKNAGKPPALGGRPFREDQEPYNTESRCGARESFAVLRRAA